MTIETHRRALPVIAYKEVFEGILSKLSAETRLRKKRVLADWILAERRCVLREVNHQRAQRAYPPITLADIERAECVALGHCDYLRKYAHAAADLVFAEKPWP